jgi:hypothetical protein
MILRRFSQSLKEQNWTAIAVEFVLLVAGVFLGIQAANWNEARIERNLARADLSQIAADLDAQTAYMEAMGDSAKLRIAAVDYIQREAFGTQLPTTLLLATETWQAPDVAPYPPDRLDNLLGAVNLVRVSARSRNAYESLISSGRLAQLRNRALAASIQRYYGNYDDLINASTMIRSFRNDGMRDQYPLGISLWDERPAAEIVALARNNPGFAAYLRTQREWAILQYGLLQNNGKETAALQSAIDKELAAP